MHPAHPIGLAHLTLLQVGHAEGRLLRPELTARPQRDVPQYGRVHERVEHLEQADHGLSVRQQMPLPVFNNIFQQFSIY